MTGKSYTDATSGLLLLKEEQAMLKPANKEELKRIIKNRIQTERIKCDLNDIDVSDITDMSDMFSESRFEGEIALAM